MTHRRDVILGDCRKVLAQIPAESVAACITDPPYNYEFIGHKWNQEEIQRRISRVKGSKTLVQNIPYGSGLAGGVRNARWYQRVRDNILEYENWCLEWGTEVFRVCKPGAFVAVFNSTRTVAHVQVALERAGFYARDMLVFRRASGIPKGLNLSEQLRRRDVPDHELWSGWHSCLRGEWEAIALLQKPLVGNYVKTFEKHGVGLMHARNDDGSFQSNILEGFQRASAEAGEAHCTVKPLGLMEKLVKLLVPPGRGSVVLDPFAGSGTTLLAAARSGLGFIGIELVPQNVETIRKRLSSEDRPSGGARRRQLALPGTERHRIR
jgi:site-specific DNA-methyltransferase (adenine-specific)